jgi:hypothetical protein
MPSLPPPLREARHDEHAVAHAVSQQTPSTQFPDAHWSALAHAMPSPTRSAQVPAVHAAPDTQSASLAHVALHAVAAASQAKKPHAVW